MLSPEDLLKMISEGEGLRTEFKRCDGKPKKGVYEAIGAFSNRCGGVVLLGVDDDGKVSGVNKESVAARRKILTDAMNNRDVLSPPLRLPVEEAEIEGKTVLYINVPRGSQLRLVKGRIYDRDGSCNYDITGSTELIAQMAFRMSGQFTELEVHPRVGEEDLRLAELMPLARKGAASVSPAHPWTRMGDLEIMRSAGLCGRDHASGQTLFNTAAILLFGRDEAIGRILPGYATDCLVRGSGQGGPSPGDRERVATNLIESFARLMDFIARHTLDRLGLRDRISREVVSNVLAHREFSGPFPATIVIEEDRLIAENWSRALFPGRVDPFGCRAYPKNPTIARFFSNIGFADSSGYGFRNLLHYSGLYAGREPEFIEGDIFRTIVPLAWNGPALPAGREPEGGDGWPGLWPACSWRQDSPRP
jgi:ATP-dependent DNA helicase RecG